MRLGRRILPALVVLGTLAGGACDRSVADNGGPSTTVNPVAPTPTGPPSSGPQPPAANPPQTPSLFEVTGVVTDVYGRPLPGVPVLMRYYVDGGYGKPTASSVQTEASGAYTIQFTARPYGGLWGTSPMAARAEIMTPGFEWYYRDVPATGPHLTENFRLHRTIVVTAGDSVAVDLSPENGDCLGWMYGPCGRVRLLLPPADGTVTLTATVGDEPAPGVVVEAFGEVQGNPITISVSKEFPELPIGLGHTRSAATIAQQVLLKTSFAPH